MNPRYRRQQEAEEAAERQATLAEAIHAGQPEVAFPNAAYELSREQEHNLVEHALARLRQLEEETGRVHVKKLDWWEHGGNDTTGNKDILSRARTWMGQRQCFEMSYEGEVDWRQYIFGGIFRQSNFSLPISRRVVQQQVARANQYFFGTEPWFAVDPQGESDEILARDSYRWVSHKFREAKIRHTLEKATEKAFIRGEAVVKEVHRREEDVYVAMQQVLIDPMTGEPKLDANGEEIDIDDPWIPADPDVIEGRRPLQPDEPMVLAADGTTPKPTNPEFLVYEWRPIARRLVHRSGPDVQLVYFKDFLCPLNAESVQTADCVVHLYDETVASLVDRYQKTGRVVEAQDADAGGETEADLDGPGRPGTGTLPLPERERAIEAFQKLAGNRPARYTDDGNDENSGSGSTMRTEREEDLAAANNVARNSPNADQPVVKVAEFWLRYDANGDGDMENILLVIDRETGMPLYYNYVGNVTDTGRRPFSVIRINPVDGRWYGSGTMSLYESIQMGVDLQYNRWNHSQTRAGRVDFWNPSATVEGESNPALQLNWGGTYTLRPGQTPTDALESIYLREIKSEDLERMINLQMQLAMNMSGVSHANDLALSGMDSVKTATGTLNVEKMGQEMFGQLISHLEDGMQDAVTTACEICLAHVDDEESFIFFEGENAITGTIRASDLRTLRLNVRLTLTRHRAEQQMQSGVTAIEQAIQFYGLAPDVQARLAPLFRQVLRALQIADADQIIQPAGMVPGAIPMDPATAGAAPMLPGAAPHGQAGEQSTQAPPPSDTFSAQMQGGQAGGIAANA